MNAPKFLALLTLAASSAWGCDNPFGYSYLAETIKPGQVEIVQWVTGRIGRDLGNGYDARYRGFDLKTEVEWGISPNEQLAVYVNSRYFERTARNGLLFVTRALTQHRIEPKAEERCNKSKQYNSERHNASMRQISPA